MNKFIDPTTNPYGTDDDDEHSTFYAHLNEHRRKILKQVEDTNTGFIQIIDKHDRDKLKEEVFVPKRAFERWAIGRSNSFNLDVILPWDNVSRSGLKMTNDCPDHSDWWIGAGLDLDYYDDFNEIVMSAAYSMKRSIQHEHLKFDKMVLTNGGKVTGRIKKLESAEKIRECLQANGQSFPDQRILEGDIIVIPHAGVEFEEAFRIATSKGRGGVITVIPNRVAHLCKIAREQDVTIMCDPDAFENLRGSWNDVTLDPDNGQIVGIAG